MDFFVVLVRGDYLFFYLYQPHHLPQSEEFDCPPNEERSPEGIMVKGSVAPILWEINSKITKLKEAEE